MRTAHRTARLVLNGITGLALASAMVLPLVTHDAPRGGYVGPYTPVNSPIQPTVGDLPAGCDHDARLTPRVAVVPNDYYVAEPLVVSTDRVLGAHRDSTLWVVGYCE